MKAVTTKGMSITRLGMNIANIVVRAEKTGDFTTVSLCRRGQEHNVASALRGNKGVFKGALE